MKNTRLHVQSVHEYFSLPKEDREIYGFYRVPFSLSWSIYDDTDGWDAFYKKIAKEYPIQYFFRVWLFSFSNPLYTLIKRGFCWPYTNLKASIHNFLNPCCPRWRNTLPRHRYSDITNLIVDSNFNLILDFYYEDKQTGHVDWQADDDHSKFYNTLTEYVKWIECTQKELENKSYEELMKATKQLKTASYSEKYNVYDALEKEIEDKKTEILKWMVESREYFWV